MTPDPQPPKRRRRFARNWHRWLGLLAALPLLWLSVTGLLLNHIVDLGLNDKRVTTEWILGSYHQIPAGEPVAFQANERLVAEWEEALYLDGKYLEGFEGKLVGAVGVKNRLIIATTGLVGIFDGTDSMELQLDELSLPVLPLEGIAESDGKLIAKSGGQWWVFSDDYLSFEEIDGQFSESVSRQLSDDERESFKKTISSNRAMPLDRVIGDAHSGKLFGWPGWLMTDLAAVGTIVLTILGLRLFPKRRT